MPRFAAGSDGRRYILEDNGRLIPIEEYNLAMGMTLEESGKLPPCEGCKEPDLPSNLRMSGEITRAAAQALTKGIKRVSEEDYQKRLAICEACEWHRKSDNRCAKCGCFLKYKARLEAWHCPIGEW